MTLVTLVIVYAERPLLQLLDQLLLDVGGGATGEGVLGLAVVEGHLLDDIRVCIFHFPLCQSLSKASPEPAQFD